jgi:glycosyltransferase involved in cell wall biosynthesis
MIKVLGLALYGPLAASTRYRLGQFVPGLAQLGIDLQIRSLLNDHYLRQRFAGDRPRLISMLRSGVDRLSDLWHLDQFDAAMLHCELFPLLPSWIECALIRRPYLYDFDDAFYLKYRSGGALGMTRPLLGNKFDRVMARAAAVTAGSRVLNDYAKRHNQNTRLLPTVVDVAKFHPLPRATSSVFTVGWIGSPSTQHYLQMIAPALELLGKEGAVRFVAIGGRAPKIDGVEIVELPWDECTEHDLLNTFDVGVMPLPEDPWAAGKCAFKLIQYMACGVPAIGSPVGANTDVLDSDCGFLPRDTEAWLDALRDLRDCPAKRNAMGANGRDRVVQHYSLQRNLPILADALLSTAALGQRTKL